MGVRHLGRHAGPRQAARTARPVDPSAEVTWRLRVAYRVNDAHDGARQQKWLVTRRWPIDSASRANPWVRYRLTADPPAFPMLARSWNPGPDDAVGDRGQEAQMQPKTGLR